VQSALDKYQREAEAASQELQLAALAADEGPRRLLTAHGDALVDAVEVALSNLGFEVENRDRTATEGDRLEDLRIRDPSEPGWLSLAEVRGYKHGAQVNDLLRIGRFVTRYVRTGATEPSRRWYIVNAFSGIDPAQRERALQSNPDEVGTFTEDGGAVIETRVLYRLDQAMRRSTRRAAEIRSFLRSATGVVGTEESV
jgi:hypothetical protein